MVCVLRVKKEDIERMKNKLDDAIDRNYKLVTDNEYGYITLIDSARSSSKINSIVNAKPSEFKLMDKKIDKIKKEESYNERLRKVLTKEELQHIPTSFDIIGDICMVRIKEELKKKEKQIGEALLLVPGIKCIYTRDGKYEGEYRTQKLKWLAGGKRKETTHVESGVRLKLNVEKVYFSTRSSNERLRIANLVRKGERVLVMFSGCSPYELVIAKHSLAKRIVGIEKNPIAHQYGLENVSLNKANEKEKRIELFCGDVRHVVPIFSEEEARFDRIIMPLPKVAYEFLSNALDVARKGAIIHLYAFDEWKGEKEMIKDWTLKLKEQLGETKRRVKVKNIVKAGDYAPNVFRICLDLEVE